MSSEEKIVISNTHKKHNVNCIKDNSEINTTVCTKVFQATNLSDTSSSLCFSTDQNLKANNLHIILTRKGMHVYGKWSKNELLGLLTQKLISNISIPPITDKSITNSNKEKLQSIIHNGVYNEYVLSELQKKGMSLYAILKVIKHGLKGLTSDMLTFFKDFNINSDTLQSEYICTDNLDDRLIINLRAIGISEPECWNIVLYGITSQRECLLYKLFLSGIDIPGILNWQTSSSYTEKSMLDFLQYIGIKEDVIELVVECGIDDETRDMLYDLGYNGKDVAYLNAQEIFSERSLIILESDDSKSNDTYGDTEDYNFKITPDVYCTPVSKETKDIDSDSAYSNNLYCFQQFTCACHINSDQKTAKAELAAQRNDYLRQNVMVPLAWAMSRALNYNPSDPTYYVAFQLLRWKYGNVPQAEMENAHRTVALATIAKDKQMEKHQKEKFNELKTNKDARSISYQTCPIHYAYRVRKQCWRYITKCMTHYKNCEFPKMCSACKIKI